jgi:hypothetical protein
MALANYAMTDFGDSGEQRDDLGLADVTEASPEVLESLLRT